ncbi:MAG TPA: helix-turn-helix domain-containing protein [Nitrososphaerales archaeon]|nr:helix-turn-helix domain-containing protein [Nitrososphaerales archaeon]
MNRTQLRLEHDMPFNNLSKMFPDASISRWCNLQVDILEVNSQRKDEIEQVKGSLKRMLRKLSAKLINISSYSERSLEAVIKCRCALNNSSVSIIEASNCIPVMPITYKAGHEFCEILAFSSKDLNKALGNLSKFGKVEIESHGSIFRPNARSSMTISVADFFGELTQKQLDALVQSIEMGYYGYPKNRTIAEMASLLKVPASTFEEHLRKAEIKIMRAISPYARIARSLGTEERSAKRMMKPKLGQASV